MTFKCLLRIVAKLFSLRYDWKHSSPQHLCLTTAFYGFLLLDVNMDKTTTFAFKTPKSWQDDFWTCPDMKQFHLKVWRTGILYKQTRIGCSRLWDYTVIGVYSLSSFRLFPVPVRSVSQTAKGWGKKGESEVDKMRWILRSMRVTQELWFLISAKFQQMLFSLRSRSKL